MKDFTVLTRDEVSASNQANFDNLEKILGFVPKLYAYIAKSETALTDYLNFENRKSTLNPKEVEVVKLVASQVNGCKYCLSAHTVLAKMHGMKEEETIEIRKGTAGFDNKLDALARFTKSTVENRGKVSPVAKTDFFNAGYTEANLIDVVMIIGAITISNYLNNITEIEIDWPLATDI